MIHKFYLNGFYIVLDVNSGAVHVVDQLSYELLDGLEAPLPANCPQKIAERLQGTYSDAEIQRPTQSSIASTKMDFYFPPMIMNHLLRRWAPRP